MFLKKATHKATQRQCKSLHTNKSHFTSDFKQAPLFCCKFKLHQCFKTKIAFKRCAK